MSVLTGGRNRAQNLGQGASVNSGRLPRGKIAGAGDVGLVNAV